LAQENYQTISYDNFRIVTNVGPVLQTGQVQEFLTILPPGIAATSAATPEPAPALLIGVGLLGAGGILRFKRKARGTGRP
jgi:hypothetical protein